MEEPNQSYDQKQARKKWEFSKRLAMINVISYLVLMVGCLACLILTQGNEVYLKDVMASITTTQVGLQMLYFGKAGVENFQKLKSAAKEITSIDEEELG